MSSYRVWFAGPRSWEAVRPIGLVLQRLVKQHGKTDLIILEGGAPGVDTIARQLCKKNGIHSARVDALWDKRGRSAGPQRNKAIAGLEPDLLCAFFFWDDLVQHPGTFSAVTIAHAAKIPVKLFHTSPVKAMPSAIGNGSPMGNRERAMAGLPPKPPKARRKASGPARDA